MNIDLHVYTFDVYSYFKLNHQVNMCECCRVLGYWLLNFSENCVEYISSVPVIAPVESSLFIYRNKHVILQILLLSYIK